MKKIFKSLLCTAVVGVTMLQSCSAFFLGSDKYTKEEYEKAGVKWEHNTILLDDYYFNGKSISQSMAESITSFYNKNEDIIKNNSKNFYVDIIEFVLSTAKEKDKEITKLTREYNNLWFENCRLRQKINELQQKINELKEKLKKTKIN